MDGGVDGCVDRWMDDGRMGVKEPCHRDRRPFPECRLALESFRLPADLVGGSLFDRTFIKVCKKNRFHEFFL